MERCRGGGAMNEVAFDKAGAAGATGALGGQRDHLADLLKIAGAFSYEGSPAVALEQLLDTVIDLLGCEMCSIHLSDPGQRCVRLSAFKAAAEHAGSEVPDAVVQMTKVESLDAGYLALARDGRPYQPDDPLAAESFSAAAASDIRFLGDKIVKVPLVSRGRLVGILTVFKEDGAGGWLEREGDWLQNVGNLIGLLIEQMNVFERFRCDSIIEERARLSQEVHDNITQMVGAIRYLSEQMTEDVRAGKVDRLEQDAETLLQLAGDAYASLREEIRDLRAAQQLGGNVVARIGEHLARFERQWGIRTSLAVQGDLAVSPHAGAQLSRIVQEALVNVRRHAQATRVDVLMESDGALVRLTLADDGIGFDPAKVSDRSFGVRIMEERARDVYGSFSVESRPGAGTTVRVAVPAGHAG